MHSLSRLLVGSFSNFNNSCRKARLATFTLCIRTTIIIRRRLCSTIKTGHRLTKFKVLDSLFRPILCRNQHFGSGTIHRTYIEETISADQARRRHRVAGRKKLGELSADFREYSPEGKHEFASNVGVGHHQWVHSPTVHRKQMENSQAELGEVRRHLGA